VALKTTRLLQNATLCGVGARAIRKIISNSTASQPPLIGTPFHALVATEEKGEENDKRKRGVKPEAA
jgi:hypothetical protein